MKKELNYLRGTIQSGEHLPRAAVTAAGALFPALPNTYDIIPIAGRDVYDSELYLLSFEVLIKSGRRSGETPATIAGWQQDLAQAKAEFELVFWDQRNKWYRYTEYPQGSAVHLDTFSPSTSPSISVCPTSSTSTTTASSWQRTSIGSWSGVTPTVAPSERATWRCPTG